MNGNIEDQTTPEQLSQRIEDLNNALKRAFDSIQELDDRITSVNQRIVDDVDEAKRDLRNDISDCERKIGSVEDDVRRMSK